MPDCANWKGALQSAQGLNGDSSEDIFVLFRHLPNDRLIHWRGLVNV